MKKKVLLLFTIVSLMLSLQSCKKMNRLEDVWIGTYSGVDNEVKTTPDGQTILETVPVTVIISKNRDDNDSDLLIQIDFQYEIESPISVILMANEVEKRPTYKLDILDYEDSDAVTDANYLYEFSYDFGNAERDDDSRGITISFSEARKFHNPDNSGLDYTSNHTISVQ